MQAWYSDILYYLSFKDERHIACDLDGKEIDSDTGDMAGLNRLQNRLKAKGMKQVSRPSAR